MGHLSFVARKAISMTVQFLIGLSGYLAVMAIYFCFVRSKSVAPKVEETAK
jgi:hypothetical protein